MVGLGGISIWCGDVMPGGDADGSDTLGTETDVGCGTGDRRWGEAPLL